MSIIASALPLEVSSTVINLLIFFQAPTLPSNIDFRALGLGMAAVSFGLIGLLMAGSAFFGEQAEQAKRTWLPTTIQGLILIGITTFLMTVLGSGIT